MVLRSAFPASLLSLLFFGLFGSLFGQYPQSLERPDIRISYELDTLTPLNSNYSEFSPVVYKDRLLFTSDRQSDLLNRNMEAWSRNSYLSLFWVELGAIFDSVAFRNVQHVSNEINIQDHTGPLVFGPDNEEAIFTRVGERVKGPNGEELRRPALFRADHKDGKWRNIERLSFSRPEHTHAHPTFLGDEAERLIFTSDREGGPGKTDLFISERKGGGWTKPKLLSDSINSAAKELFPYCTDSALFFASDRPGGFGGLDIYCSLLREDGSWGEPHHLKKPLNSAGDDLSIFLKRNREEGYLSSSRKGGEGKDDIYGLKVIEKVVVQKSALSGRFRYRKLEGEYPAGRTVELVDDDGKVLMRTKTDSNGHFSFKELPGDKDVTVRMKDTDADVELMMGGEKEGVSLMKNGEGEFVYRKLEGDRTGTRQLIRLSDPSMDTSVADLSGQFVYERLPSQKAGKRTLQLIDDDGRVVRSKTTDERGNFSFQKLDGDKNRRIKLKKVPEEDLKLLIYNGRGEVVAQLKSGDDGIFDYRRLEGDDAGKRLLDTQDPQLGGGAKRSLYGKFEYKKLQGDVPDGMKIKVLNDEGEIQFTSTTDSAGYFRFLNASLGDSMAFDVISDQELKGEMIAKIMNRYGEVLAVLHKNEDGLFVYRQLEGDTADADLKDAQDTELTLGKGASEEREKDTAKKEGADGEPLGAIGFGVNSSYLDEEGEKELARWAEKFKRNERPILVEGHASARGNSDYNEWISRRRAKRVREGLIELGIDPERIEVEWYGDKRLLNDCEKASECTEQEHARNRRVELSYR